MAQLFTPVPVRARVDGWTPDRQHAFIDALARLGSVAYAARSVGKSPRSAWRLRDRPDAEAFRDAWDAAVDAGQQSARDRALERATEGVEEPVVRRGRIVGHVRRYDDRLLLAALRSHAAPPLFERRRRALAEPANAAREEAAWQLRLLQEQQAILAARLAGRTAEHDATSLRGPDIRWQDFR